MKWGEVTKQSDIYEKKLVPITLFNKGKASQIFESVREEKTIFVLKNNRAVSVVLAPEEYSGICALAEYCGGLLRDPEVPESRRQELQKLLDDTSLVDLS